MPLSVWGQYQMQTEPSVQTYIPFDESKLFDRLVGILEWAAQHLPMLDAYATYWESEEDAFLRRQDKIAAEAILLAYLASRLGTERSPRLASVVLQVYEQAKRQIATKRNEAILRRFPQTAPTLGVGYVLLFQMGYANSTIEYLLRAAVSNGYAMLSERSTFRMMDLRWTFGLLDPVLVDPIADLLPLTTLAASPHPIYTMNEDEYAITHAIFYLTDFGCRQSATDLPFDSSDLLDPYMMWNAVQLDLDLLGEFIIAALALDMPHTPAYRFAWDVLDRAWTEQHRLAGPEFSPGRLAELDGQEAEAYEFSQNYHTIFVGGILCAVALQGRTCTPAPKQTPPVEPTALGQRCMDAVQRCTLQRQANYELPVVPKEDLPEWMVAQLLSSRDEEVASMPAWLQSAMHCPLKRDELSEALFEALLTTSSRHYSLVQLAETLAVGAEYRILRTSPTFVRALEFLLSQQLQNGFVGVQQLLGDDPGSFDGHESQAAIAACLAHISRQLLAQVSKFL